MPLLPELGKQSRDLCEIQASLDYIARKIVMIRWHLSQGCKEDLVNFTSLQFFLNHIVLLIGTHKDWSKSNTVMIYNNNNK